MTTTLEERWQKAEAELKANPMNLIQINVMWQIDGRTRVETIFSRNIALIRMSAEALRLMQDVARVDIVSPLGTLIEEWSRNK